MMAAPPTLSLVNVNFPREPRGLIWTRISVRHYDGHIVPTQDPQGRDFYWFSVVRIEEAEEGTDRWAVEQGWISLTPLRIDLTDERQLREVRVQHPLDEERAVVSSPATSSREQAQAIREDEAATSMPSSNTSSN